MHTIFWTRVHVWVCICHIWNSAFLIFVIWAPMCVLHVSVTFDSLQPHGLQPQCLQWPPARLLCPWIYQAITLKWVAISPGDLPNPGTEHAYLGSSALAGGFLTSAPPRKPYQANRVGVMQLNFGQSSVHRNDGRHSRHSLLRPDPLALVSFSRWCRVSSRGRVSGWRWATQLTLDCERGTSLLRHCYVSAFCHLGID